MSVSSQNGRSLAQLLALLLSATSTLLAGCANPHDRVPPIFGVGTSTASTGGAGGYGIKPGDRADDLRPKYAYPVNLEIFKFPGKKDTEDTAYVEASKDSTGKARNRLQDYLARISDEVCTKHKGDILAVSSTWNGGLSVFTTVVGGLGAIFTAGTTTRALAGTAGIGSGIRSNINENVFYNNFGTAIVRQIDAQRKQKLVEVAPKRMQSLDDYSADAALRDVDEYHNLCSFYEAVAALATETKRPPTADELRGRIDGLRDQQTKNTARIGELNRDAATKDGAEVKQLINDNATVGRMISALTVQLGIVQGAPGATQPADAKQSQP